MNKNINTKFNDELNRFAVDVGHFMNLSKQSLTSSSRNLNQQVRKKSIHLRNSLKKLRQLSIDNEKFLKEYNKKIKEKSIEELECK